MPPILALSLGTALTLWLVRKDAAVRGKLAPALRIPFLWLLIISSRPVAEWLNFGGGDSETGGNPMDATIQFVLIAAAFFVLRRRGFPLNAWPSLNKAYFILFLYFAVSMIWAPYSFVAFKRLFKEFGQILVILVILTENDPVAAIKILASRCAIVLFPLSVVLIKYYPAYGRSFSVGGMPMVTGVTTQKNSLGEICAVFGLVLLWDFLDAWSERPRGQRLKFLFPRLVVLGLGIWLLLWSESKTSLLALLIGSGIFLALGHRVIQPVAPFAKLVFTGISVGLLVTYTWTFAVAPLLHAVGRNETFTERTQIWNSVLKQDINAWFGCGYYSFWLAKEEDVWLDWPGHFKPHSAHCGYLEMYLDGGYVGCFFLFIFLFATCWRLANLCAGTDRFPRVLFALAMISLVLNFSEVYFFRLDLSWFFLVLAAMGSHPYLFEQIQKPAETTVETGPESELAKAA